MAVLEGLEPKAVFEYFEEICSIPHGSGNTKKISDHCVDFAKKHGLKYIQDALNNVIIFKPGTEGYEDSAPVMIQGHLDMVCEKEAGCDIDFEKDGLNIKIENGYVTAEGTTLGGDDGIAVAFALAILAADDIPHPPIEAIFTVDEETGMFGAADIDCSVLTSRVMLNLDSEDEGVLLVSCAGGNNTTCHIPIKREKADGVCLRIEISGLTGGHSGVEIDKSRANANKLMSRFINELRKEIACRLISINGGLKENAIPRECIAEIVVSSEDVRAARVARHKFYATLSGEYIVSDPELSFEVTEVGRGTYNVMTEDVQRRLITALINLPEGIQRMSADIPGLVQTSLNMGVLKTDENEVYMRYAVRSSIGTEKEELISRMANLMDMLGGTIDCIGDYPAWEYKKDSKLRDIMIKIFEKQYGYKPKVQALHAGVECGLFAGKMPGLDCVSFGPEMKDIHTPNERMDIGSVQRTWKYVLEILKELK